MRSKHYGIIILILVSIQTVWSQKEFHSGYIVLNNKDTIYGEIQDRDVRRGRLYEKIRFRSENGKRKKYSAHDLMSYMVGKTVYESMWFDEDSYFFKFYYTHKYGTGKKTFLKLNTKGKVSCYTKEFVDFDCNGIDGFELFLKQGEKHFQRADQGIFGLKKKKLMVYFKDCPVLVSNLNKGMFKYAFEVAAFYNNSCE